MEIQKMMKDYQKRSDVYYTQFENNDTSNKIKRPNFLKEVILPILNALPEALPGYGFAYLSDDYIMYGDYYRIKAGIILLGGFSIGDDFELYFTPLFHGQSFGDKVEITTFDQLVIILQDIYQKRKELLQL